MKSDPYPRKEIRVYQYLTVFCLPNPAKPDPTLPVPLQLKPQKDQPAEQRNGRKKRKRTQLDAYNKRVSQQKNAQKEN